MTDLPLKEFITKFNVRGPKSTKIAKIKVEEGIDVMRCLPKSI
jgi:hypothetical protein